MRFVPESVMVKLHAVVIGRVRLHAADGWHEVIRFGTPKAAGGRGVEWACDCPTRSRLCDHLKLLFAGRLAATDVELTPEGATILRPTAITQRQLL